MAIGGVLVYIGHDNSNTTLDSEKTSKASDASSTKSAVESSSIDETISASGTDYKITTVNGLGGVFANPVAITKILNEKTALDIIASIPNFNHYKLTSIVNNGDQWNAKINVQDVAYEVTLSHYQGTMGIISLTEGGNNKKGMDLEFLIHFMIPIVTRTKRFKRTSPKPCHPQQVQLMA